MNSFFSSTMFSSKFTLDSVRWCYIPHRKFIFSTKLRISRGIAIAASQQWAERTHSSFSRRKESIHEPNGEWQGKLLPTTSRLFKLIIPLPSSIPFSSGNISNVAYLLHPSQPLSHISNLLAASVASTTRKRVHISFRSVPPDDPDSEVEVEWSDATDLGDFIKSVVSEEHFDVVISLKPMESYAKNEVDATYEPAGESSSQIKPTKENDTEEPREIIITIKVPSFQDRTRFLRRRLQSIDMALNKMEPLKQDCDGEAHRGARRMAVSGFGMLVVYWLGVARLTFYDYGWDVMEPVTYLSGLSTVICGYLWFLYKGREVSYTSVLSQSVSARRLTLYKSKGFDLERWADLIAERKSIRQEMNKIAEDYDIQWDGQWGDENRSGTKDEEKEQIKEQTVQSDTESRNDAEPGIVANEGHSNDKLKELDRELNR